METPPVSSPSEQKVISSSPFHLILLGFILVVIIALSSFATYWYLTTISPSQTYPSLKTIDYAPKSEELAKDGTLVNQEVTGTSSLKHYVSSAYGFTVSYPGTFVVDTSGSHSVTFSPQHEGPGFPSLYITVLPDGFTNADYSAYNYLPKDDIDSFLSLPVGGTRNTYKGMPDQDGGNWSFTKLADVTLPVGTGVVVENSNVFGGVGKKDRRVFLTNNNTVYMLGTYYDSDGDLATFQTFLQSFTFTK